MRVSEEPVCYRKIQFLPPCFGDLRFMSYTALGGKSCICVAKTIEEGLDIETERLYQLDDHVQD